MSFYYFLFLNTIFTFSDKISCKYYKNFSSDDFTSSHKAIIKEAIANETENIETNQES